jgi:23S rRNA pseudouridine955/2504/2580 synthase
VAARYAGFSLLDVTIKTGRTHQIRVHLSHEGHPIVGDEKYGDFALNKALAAGRAVAGALRPHVPARPAAGLRPPGQRGPHRAGSPLPPECETLLAQLTPATAA